MLIHLLSDYIRNEELRRRVAQNVTEVLDEYGITPELRGHLRDGDMGRLLGRIVAESYDFITAITTGQAASPGEGAAGEAPRAIPDQAQGLTPSKIGGPAGILMPWPPPEFPLPVTSITPSSARRNTSTTFTIHGSGFANGARVTFTRPPNITVIPSSVVYLSSDTLRATATFRTAGLYSVGVTNPSGEKGGLPAGLEIQA